MIRHTLLIALPLLIISCDSKKASPAPPTGTESIDVLEHDEGTFTLDRSIPIAATASVFHVDDLAFTITHRWPHAETTRNVTDDAERANHAIEVAWTVDGDEQKHWIFQTDSDETMSPLPEINALVRLTPPGAKPPVKDDPSFTGQVQYLYQGSLFDLPDPGGEIFDGWQLKSTKSYQHALLDDEGGVAESPDGSFANRVLEVLITDGKGNTERHLAFLDHPEITRGIHPTILPVTRLEGNSASQSRIAVRTPVQPATEQHIVQITPEASGERITARVWIVGETEFKTIDIEKLPAELALADKQTLTIGRHFTLAQSQVKWERQEIPETGEAKPALVIEHSASHHQKDSFVLIRDEVTPCRINQKHLMLRYTKSGE